MKTSLSRNDFRFSLSKKIEKNIGKPYWLVYAWGSPSLILLPKINIDSIDADNVNYEIKTILNEILDIYKSGKESINVSNILNMKMIIFYQ